MLKTNLKYLISVDASLDTPQYLQVSNGFIRAIEQGRFCKGDQLPSIRQLCDQLEISFNTAKKAYAVLKKRNIVTASQGKSNVINTSWPLLSFHVFLLLNELSAQNKIIYDAIMQSLPEQGVIDLHIYNNNNNSFRHLLKNKKNCYTHHIIIPPANNSDWETASIINEYLEGQELIILGEKVEGIDVPHSCVYEDYENDIYAAMESVRHLLQHYHAMNIVLPEGNSCRLSILKGFKRFCYDNEYITNECHGVKNRAKINRRELFVTLTDEDLVQLIGQLKMQKLVPGRDIGIISYNETPLKEVLLEGITTISTDYRKMSELAVKQMTRGIKTSIAVPFKLLRRSSL